MSRAMPRLVSVVVPLLDEEKGLGRLVERLETVLAGLGAPFEVVFVDDGSSDGTLAALKALNRRDPRMRTVSFSRNFGKEVALAAGLRYAAGDVVVTMDGDLQHPPERIADFIARWREGYDIVFATRTNRETDSPARRAFSRGFYRLFAALTRSQLPEGAGDFRLLDRRAVDAMNRLGERARFNKGLFSWIGFRSTSLPYEVPPRADGGPSRWKPGQLVRFAIDGLVSFSTLPLRVWSYVGVVVSALAFAYVLGYLAKTMIFGFPSNAPGFPTLVIAVMFLGGVQLISLGVIGEYLGRVYEEVKARPLFIVAEAVGFPAGKGSAREDGLHEAGGHEAPHNGAAGG